jgi:hypothetical protein
MPRGNEHEKNEKSVFGGNNDARGCRSAGLECSVDG